MVLMYRVRTVFTGVAGTPWYSNIFTQGGGATQVSIDAVHDFWTAIAGSMHQAIDWEVEGTVPEIDSATGQITRVLAGNEQLGAGLSVATPLPYANQGLVSWRTGLYLAGRELRGKTFIPGVTENGVQGGVLTPSTISVYDTAAEALIDSPAGVLVFSPTRLTAAPAVTSTVGNMVAVLRSRRD